MKLCVMLSSGTEGLVLHDSLGRFFWLVTAEFVSLIFLGICLTYWAVMDPDGS